MTGLTAASEWGTYLLWKNAVPFGIEDPQFGLDLSFYTFTLPFIRFVIGFAFGVVLLCLLAVVAVQYVYGGLRLQPKGDRASAAAQSQLSLLIGLFVLLKAVSYWFDRFELATQSQQLVAGFTGLKYTDVYAVLPALNILAAVSLLVAALFFVNVFRRRWAIPVIGAVLLVVTSIVVGTVYPLIVQQFQVRPSELVREQPYLERNINATRAAYDIADSEVVRLRGHRLAADRRGARRQRRHAERDPPARPGRRVARRTTSCSRSAATTRSTTSSTSTATRSTRTSAVPWWPCARSTSPASPTASATGPTTASSTRTATASWRRTTTRRCRTASRTSSRATSRPPADSTCSSRGCTSAS